MSNIFYLSALITLNLKILKDIANKYMSIHAMRKIFIGI